MQLIILVIFTFTRQSYDMSTRKQAVSWSAELRLEHSSPGFFKARTGAQEYRIPKSLTTASDGRKIRKNYNLIENLWSSGTLSARKLPRQESYWAHGRRVAPRDLPGWIIPEESSSWNPRHPTPGD